MKRTESWFVVETTSMIKLHMVPWNIRIFFFISFTLFFFFFPIVHIKAYIDVSAHRRSYLNYCLKMSPWRWTVPQLQPFKDDWRVRWCISDTFTFQGEAFREELWIHQQTDCSTSWMDWTSDLLKVIKRLAAVIGWLQLNGVLPSQLSEAILKLTGL